MLNLILPVLLAATMQGARPELLGPTSGFASSLAVNSRKEIYYTTTAGDVVRFDETSAKSAVVAHVVTQAIGNSGLLGMALLDDDTAVVHYTTPGQAYDVISKIDLATGEETEVHRFVGDVSLPGRGTPPEHHGGNPSVAADGSIFVGIGDYGGGVIASLPDWNGGKIFRIDPDGRVEQFARGVRNPFDMAFDVRKGLLFAPDNGAAVDDEINIVPSGVYLGWPFTAGKQQAIEGATPPVYVFPTVVAPTGVVHLSGHNRLLNRGYLVGSFVAKAIFWFPDEDVRPLPDPIAVIDHETSFIIDIAERSDGELYFTTGTSIYHLATTAPRLRVVKAGGH